jgi:hypothetical protein
MNWADVPEFYASLEEPTLTHLALRLLILNPGVRSKPLRHLRLEQIEGDVWTVPEGVMKGRKGKSPAYRVPLCQEAKRIIDLARPHSRNGYLFPNTRSGVISDMPRCHGTWSGGAWRQGPMGSVRPYVRGLPKQLMLLTKLPRLCFRTRADSGAVRAYRRTDFLEQRLALSERWADYVTGGAGQVVKLVGSMK